MRKSTLFISVALTTLILVILFGVMSVYKNTRPAVTVPTPSNSELMAACEGHKNEFTTYKGHRIFCMPDIGINQIDATPTPVCTPLETDGVGPGLEYFRATQPTLIVARWANHFGGQRVPITLATGEAVTFTVATSGTVDVLQFCESDGPETYLNSPTTYGIAEIKNEALIKKGLIKIDK